MFYMLANVHHQNATGEVLPPSDRFWYYLPDLPFGIQNAAASFRLELEHLVSRETPQSTILFGAARTDVLSLCTFLEILSGNGLEYDSDDIDCYAPPRMCYYINGEVPTDEAPKLMPPDLSPRSHTNYLQEKADRLRARQVDLEATEAEIEHQRQDLAWQQATQPPRNDDDARTGAPSTLRFPRAAYNMAAAAC